MSGRVYLLGVGLALVALAFIVTERLLTPPPGITLANSRRIRIGMTLVEVEAVLGRRPSKELLQAEAKFRLEVGIFRRPPSKGPTFTSSPYALKLEILDREVRQEDGKGNAPSPHEEPEPERDNDAVLRFWKGQEGTVEILFDGDGRVTDFTFWPAKGNGPFAQFRVWLGQVTPSTQPRRPFRLKRLPSDSISQRKTKDRARPQRDTTKKDGL